MAKYRLYVAGFSLGDVRAVTVTRSVSEVRKSGLVFVNNHSVRFQAGKVLLQPPRRYGPKNTHPWLANTGPILACITFPEE